MSTVSSGRDAPGDLAELRKGREELVVARRHRRRRQEEPHRHGVDHGVEFFLIAHGLGDRRLVGRAGLLDEEPVRQPHAEALLRRPLDQRLRVDRTREMDMQVGALRHSVEERAQRRMVVAQGVEALRGDRSVEVTGDDEKANGGDRRRQQDDPKDDPASQGVFLRSNGGRRKLAAPSPELKRRIAAFSLRVSGRRARRLLAGRLIELPIDDRDGGGRRCRCPAPRARLAGQFVVEGETAGRAAACGARRGVVEVADSVEGGR